MTFVVELGATVAKTAVSAAAPAVTATMPKLATEAVRAGVKTLGTGLVEPVAKTALPAVETAAKPIFEAARPVREAGKAVPGPIMADVLTAIPQEARLPLLARGFFSEAGANQNIVEKTLTPTEMGMLVRTADINLPADVLENPVFAQAFSRIFRNELTNAEPENFSLAKTVWRSLRRLTQEKKDANDTEKLKRKAVKEAIQKKVMAMRQSILEDRRMNDDEKDTALLKVKRYEMKLNVGADIRMTFGKNFVTDTIDSFLSDPTLA